MAIFPTNFVLLFTAVVLHNDHSRHRTISRQANRVQHKKWRLFHPEKGNSLLNSLHFQLTDSTAISDALVVRSATRVLTAKFDKIRQ